MSKSKRTFTKRTFTPRKQAYLALLFVKKGGFIEDFFSSGCGLSSQDLALAYEIACGVERRQLTLKYLAEKIYSQQQPGEKSKAKLKLKSGPRLLLYMALYQVFFMQKIPFYAVVDETVKLAKTYFHVRQAAFFNAYLRAFYKSSFCKSSFQEEVLSKTETLKDLADFYSYPEFFIRKLIAFYGLKKTQELLDIMNQTPVKMARVRKKMHVERKKDKNENKFEMIVLKKGEKIGRYVKSTDYYIQNFCSVFLMQQLVKNFSQKPQKILDLCAAPGGKLLLLADLYPESKIFANDLTDKKLRKIKENLAKYKLAKRVELFSGPAENFSSSQKFDLIVVDAPCSNSGVLHKRPEARWRLDQKNLKALQEKQLQILKNAASLLSKNGQIWYLTCSILKDENEDLVCRFLKAEQKLGLKLKSSFLKLPDYQGTDGGFGSSFGF